MKAAPLPLVLVFLLGGLGLAASPDNWALTGQATSADSAPGADPGLAIDGYRETIWVSSSAAGEKSLTVQLPNHVAVTRVSFELDLTDRNVPSSFALQTFLNGYWKDVVRREVATEATVTLTLDEPKLTDELRLAFFDVGQIALKEFGIYGERYAADTSAVRAVILNQSGFNLGRPKRFTAPQVADGTSFQIQELPTRAVVHAGQVQGQIGDFSRFDPRSDATYVAVVGEAESFPFRIGPYWMERVGYRNSLDFLIGARHYVGSTREIRTLSWAWRDGDFFNWALQSLIAQYFSNPAAYEGMDSTIRHVPNESFPAEYRGWWGALEPYDEAAPDIVKLIHWDADVKLSQRLEHQHQKGELAHFLFAFPDLQRWLPAQNFAAVYAYLRTIWGQPGVRADSTTQYDRSENHDMLALKTRMGTTKGELPPGASVIPNLMMYEVARRQGESDASKYFDAAYRQLEWMIAHLDWEDPITTKGQRMSEHLTMRAFAYFYHQYPDRHPRGLQSKVRTWAEVVVRRSANLWDFRRYTDEGSWAPPGWNETGNILGFPAAAFAARSVIESEDLRQRLDVIAWAHFDNGFGRNPLGRHSSYDGPREIEGVDLGWFQAHEGGIGLLEAVPFVFDGSPKAEHYPHHPELGDFGWTEGWVQFNVAYNVALAYLAHDSTQITIQPAGEDAIAVRLRAPLNLREDQVDRVEIELRSSRGATMPVMLTQEGPYARFLSARLPLDHDHLVQGDHRLLVQPDDEITVSYGLSYFQRSATLRLMR